MPNHPYKQVLGVLLIILFLVLAMGADASVYQDTYPQQKTEINKLQALSECRALMHYYADLMGISYQVNSLILGIDKDSSVQASLRDSINGIIDRAAQIKQTQSDIGKTLLQDIPQPVIVEIVAVAYAEGLRKISDQISGRGNLGNIPARKEFLQNYVNSSTKCANFLYEG